MIWAIQAMVSDDVLYNCRFLCADGDLGAYLQCKRPVGIQVASGSLGFLGFDAEGSNIFIPADLSKLLAAGTHIALSISNGIVTISETGTRVDATQALRLEVRTSDPVSAELGRIWLRSS